MSKLYGSSILVFLLICSAFNKQQSPTGKELYEKNCIRCHSSEGTKHFLGAKDLQKSKMDDDAIVRIIQNGKRFMPSYKKKLSTDEINKLTDYVKQLRK